MATGLQWIREDTPRWDADKQRLFGPAEIAATALTPPGPGAPVADAWWHVTDAAGAVVGYGWLDSEWGDAEVTFLVDPARRGEGIGEFIVDPRDQSRPRVGAGLATRARLRPRRRRPPPPRRRARRQLARYLSGIASSPRSAPSSRAAIRCLAEERET